MASRTLIGMALAALAAVVCDTVVLACRILDAYYRESADAAQILDAIAHP